MKILIQKVFYPSNTFFHVGIEDGEGKRVWLDDTAHLKLGEIEAMGRAKGFQTLTGWPIIKQYELD